LHIHAAHIYLAEYTIRRMCEAEKSDPFCRPMQNIGSINCSDDSKE